MVKCKHCGSEQYTKDGIIKGEQGYRCKRRFREGDLRETREDGKGFIPSYNSMDTQFYQNNKN